jgi:electron-transferring-flavoprotein dehydrogenase
MLDYWLEIMDVDPADIPEDVILRRLEGAEFIGPSASLTLRDTGMSASYPHFGFAFHRARFDDWLREEAEAVGAQYRVGDSVTGVTTDLDGSPTHTVSLAGGEQLEADALVLADGPQRTVTTGVLDQFLPAGTSVADRLAAPRANHIAYQEHRRIPEEIYEPHFLKFWWGLMPGHTAYPWIFPNDGTVARIGLTMPIGLDIDDYDASEWGLLRPDDEQIPTGSIYLRRLLEREYPSYDIDDFPLVEDRGKRGGTETYPISSTRPIDSPTAANVAVVGGAMGTTSAFHEGGDHVAVRTGSIAGDLAARGRLGAYNDAWREAIGAEVLRNVTMADLVRDFGPADWDRTFRAVETMTNRGQATWPGILRSGVTGMRLFAGYKLRKRRFAGGGYVQLHEDEYEV